MATVTTGIFPYDSEYVASRISVLEQLRTSGTAPAGFTVVRTATQIQYQTADGTFLTFTGAGFNTTGALNAGSLSAITEITSPSLVPPNAAVFAITGITGISFANPVTYEAIFAGADTVNGGAADGDILFGLNGNDTMNGGAGADVMVGGSNNDTYIVDNVGDFIDDSDGVDTVQSSVNFSLSGLAIDGDLENLTLTGTALSGTGNGLGNVLTGNASNNVLSGLGGNDTLVGGDGIDTLNGGGDQDTLDGGTGADTLIGGDGNDTFVYDGTDNLVELAGQGDDTVRSSVSFDLSNPAFEHFENVTLTGNAAINATGDANGNDLFGNNANNVLDGGGGGDEMRGYGGNDTYIYDDEDDEAFEASPAGGVDTVVSSVNVGSLNAFIENVTLTGGGNLGAEGNNLANVLTGNSGNNSLNGQGGNDTMAGGFGDDTYVVDQTGDLVQEAAGAGDDTVVIEEGAQLTSYILAPNVENLFGAEGSATGMSLTGNALGNHILGTDLNDTLDGAAGADRMVGFDGNDTYVVDDAGDEVSEALGAGTDTVQSSMNFVLFDNPNVEGNVENLTLIGAALMGTGNNLGNVLTGNALDNTLVGLEGNDTLDGGAGNDTLLGGIGSDTYLVNAAGDVIIEVDDEDGIDTVVANNISFSIENDAFLENVTLTGNAAANATGNATGEGNTLIGNDGANVLDGKAGGDTMIGGLGGDTYFVDNVDDDVMETVGGTAGGVDTVNSSVSYTLGDNVENLNLTGSAFGGYGNALANIIQGTDGDNVLGGGGGVDTMRGYGGDDTYIVDVSGDVVVEAANGGVDTVIFNPGGPQPASYVLAAEVERLFNTGGGNVTLTGNALNNEIVVDKAGATNDTLDGGAGADSMAGGEGNDQYMVDDPGDAIFDEGGTDRVTSSVSFSLDGTGVENLTLTGSAAEGIGSNDSNEIRANLTGAAVVNTLIGGDGNDTLDGGLGNDVMQGGDGNDSYFVDSATDLVVETFDGGTDTVNSSITYTLTPDVEDLRLTGAAPINGTGNDLDNNLFGNAGNNVLNGGAGADEMTGGLGSDTYHVDDEGDSIIEEAGGVPGGIDVVRSTVTFDLALHSAFLENLVLVGTTPADSEPIDGYGNALNNKIDGNAAANLLDGRQGADTLAGYGGDDVYRIDHAGDVIVAAGNELAGAGPGFTDTVEAAVSFTLLANLENLTLLEAAAALNATGNDLVNVLVGNDNNNRLDGMGGADIMAGGFGNDTYIVGAGDTVLEEDGAGTGDTVISSVSHSLGANLENLTLTGAAATSGTGNELNNVLTAIGATGTSLAGLGGDDTYIVDGQNDDVDELEDQGTDEIRSSVTYALAGDAHVEILTLTGTAANATGNAFVNTLNGNAAANQLNGGGEADIMNGGAGNDTYFVDNEADAVQEANGLAGGIDTVRTTVSYGLPDSPGLDSVENLILEAAGGEINGTGNDARNTITGNASANELNGLAGADTMIGGAGNDLYIVDNNGDRVDEVANGGAGNSDTVESSVSFTLSAGVENLILAIGAEAARNARGNGLVNSLTGNEFANYLNGEGGADTMEGGAGNDTYVVDGADLIVEEEGDDADQVFSSVTIDFSTGALADADIENITLTGANAINATGNDLDNEIDGNSAANTLIGGIGSDDLDGKGGVDTMNGGDGNDILRVDNVGDTVQEAGGEGTDTVRSTVSYTLTGGAEIELFILEGNRNINATGNEFNNAITGNSGNNVLNGMGGIDGLAGGDGNDVLIWDVLDEERDGGNGFDTLRVVGGGQAITGDVADNIERIDLNVTAGGNNSLTVNTEDVLDMLGAGVDDLFVNGNALDDVILDQTEDEWALASTPQQVVNGILYNVYDGGDVSIYIQNGIEVTFAA